MNRWVDGACRVIEGLIALMLAVMVVLVFGNVVLRYGFNSGITVSEEISRWLFIWMTFLGAVVALRERGHLGVDMVVQRLPRWGKKACLAIGHLVTDAGAVPHMLTVRETDDPATLNPRS